MGYFNLFHAQCAVWVEFSLAAILKGPLVDEEVAKLLRAEFQAKKQFDMSDPERKKGATNLDIVSVQLGNMFCLKNFNVTNLWK